MSIERWESREPDSVVKPDPALLRAMERQAFFANIRTFVIGILVVATIAGVALSAGAVAALTGVTAAGTLVAHLITRWIANRE